jgi:hypothetical protein
VPEEMESDRGFRSRRIQIDAGHSVLLLRKTGGDDAGMNVERPTPTRDDVLGYFSKRVDLGLDRRPRPPARGSPTPSIRPALIGGQCRCTA